MPSILFIFSSAGKTQDGKVTGYSLPEASHPYYILSRHCTITFASPDGPNPPVDPKSVERFSQDIDSVVFLIDEEVKLKFGTAKRLKDVNPQDYDALLYVGGHNSTIDLPDDPSSIKLAAEFFTSGKIIAALCHGLAALINVKNEQQVSILSGRNFTGFFNYDEEPLAAITMLRQQLAQVGGTYHNAKEKLEPEVVVDGQLYTGQNLSSARPLAEEILSNLKRLYGLYPRR